MIRLLVNYSTYVDDVSSIITMRPYPRVMMSYTMNQIHDKAGSKVDTHIRHLDNDPDTTNLGSSEADDKRHCARNERVWEQPTMVSVRKPQKMLEGMNSAHSMPARVADAPST